VALITLADIRAAATALADPAAALIISIEV
jgi:hypothetical protein